MLRDFTLNSAWFAPANLESRGEHVIPRLLLLLLLLLLLVVVVVVVLGLVRDNLANTIKNLFLMKTTEMYVESSHSI